MTQDEAVRRVLDIPHWPCVTAAVAAHGTRIRSADGARNRAMTVGHVVG